MKTVIAVTLTTTAGTRPDMLEYAVREALSQFIDAATPWSEVHKAKIDVGLVSSLSFAEMAYTENTGGNCMADVFHLSHGKVLVIADDDLAVYPTLADWDNDTGEPRRPSIPLY
jgi:hypothetical protein